MEKKTGKIAIALSGGVDSSVAAKILKDQGHNVVGIFFVNQKNDLKMSKPKFSASARARRDGLMSNKIPIPELKKYPNLYDAHRVAKKLNIPLYVVDVTEKFNQEVIRYFLNEYKHLRTPNPCVVCNQKIKFGWLLDFAEKIGCDYLATGHYARISQTSYLKPHNDNLKLKNNRDTTFHLLKARDKNKDQSYFLYRLNQKQLSKIIFPLGEYTKDEVRAMAKKWQPPVLRKKESQETCFVADKNINDYLRRHIPAHYFKPGNIVDAKGNIVGEHDGLINYTIGQRKGIEQTKGLHQISNCSNCSNQILNSKYKIQNTSDRSPLYVIGLDRKKNQLVVGEDKEVYRNEMFVEDVHFTAHAASSIQNIADLTVKIRYRHSAVPCVIKSLNTKFCMLNAVKVDFDQPQRAITPGQSAVFYLPRVESRGIDDEVIGGGIISSI